MACEAETKALKKAADANQAAHDKNMENEKRRREYIFKLPREQKPLERGNIIPNLRASTPISLPISYAVTTAFPNEI